MSLQGTFISDLTYIEALFGIVIGWTLVGVWQRWIDNFTFNTLKLNKSSAYHTFVIAIVITVIFVSFIFIFNTVLGDIVESDIPDLNPPSPPPPPISMNDFMADLQGVLN